MKRLLVSIFIAAMLTSCTEKTPFGHCIGIIDEGDPKLLYKLDIRNAIIMAIFFETIIVPVVWAADYARCPVAEKGN